MPIDDPNERARRAVIRSIDNLTELVNIILDDPNDEDPDPLAFQVEPNNLFSLTFSRVGISNDALISGFIVGLKTLLPEIKARIQELLRGLQPGVQIELVFNVVRRELATPRGDGVVATESVTNAATSKSTKKSSKKTGARRG